MCVEFVETKTPKERPETSIYLQVAIEHWDPVPGGWGEWILLQFVLGVVGLLP